jgi:hypothetical protein
MADPEQALAAAAQGSSDDDRAILQSCIGFFLFGVPNRGLNARNLKTLVRGQNNARLIEDLKEGSPLLLHIHHAFQNSFTYKDCLIVSFFETKDSRTVKVLPYSPLFSIVLTVLGARSLRMENGKEPARICDW